MLGSAESTFPQADGGRRLRCPCCGADRCRCRACGTRYPFGAAATCTVRAHGGETPALFCRCGARVRIDDVETPTGKRVALLVDPLPARGELIGRLRARDRARTRLAWLMRVARARGSTRRNGKRSVEGAPLVRGLASSP